MIYCILWVCAAERNMIDPQLLSLNKFPVWSYCIASQWFLMASESFSPFPLILNAYLLITWQYKLDTDEVWAHHNISIESARAHVKAFIVLLERKWDLIWHEICYRKLPLQKLNKIYLNRLCSLIALLCACDMIDPMLAACGTWTDAEFGWEVGGHCCLSVLQLSRCSEAKGKS